MSALNRLVRLIDEFHSRAMRVYSLIKKAQKIWTMPDEPEDEISETNELNALIDEAKSASYNQQLIAQFVAIVETCKQVINNKFGYSTIRGLIEHFRSLLSDYDEDELQTLLVNLDAIIQTEARANNVNTKIPDNPNVQGAIRKIISDEIAKGVPSTIEEDEEEKEDEYTPPAAPTVRTTEEGDGEEEKEIEKEKEKEGEEEEDKKISPYKKPGQQADKSRFEQQSIIKRLGAVNWEEYYSDKIKDLRETLKGETNPETLNTLAELETVLIELGKLSNARSALVNEQQKEIRQIHIQFKESIASLRYTIEEDTSKDITEQVREHARKTLKALKQKRQQLINMEKAKIKEQLQPQIEQIKIKRHESFLLQRRLENKINPIKNAKKREALVKLLNESEGAQKLILEQEIALIDLKNSQDSKRRDEIKERTEFLGILRKGDITRDVLNHYKKTIENAKAQRLPVEIKNITKVINEQAKIRSGGISGLAEQLRKQIASQKSAVNQRVKEVLLPAAIKRGYFKKYEDAINNAKQAIKDAPPTRVAEIQNYLIRAEQARAAEETKFIEEHDEQKRVQTNSEELATFREQVSILDKSQWFDEQGNVVPEKQQIVSTLIQTGNNLIAKYNKEIKDGGFPEAVKTIQQIINVLTNPLTKEKTKARTPAFLDKFDPLPKSYQNIFKKLNISPTPTTYEDLKNLMAIQNKPESLERALQALIEAKFNPNIPIR